MTSLCVAAVNTSLVMPLDCVKTHLEKVAPQSTYRGAFQAIYSKAGITGFFTGVRLRVILSFTNALFVVNLLEHLKIKFNF